ncbi:hypothetical protein NDU88_001750 [Pleurodeles waltl]|uniref:Uncharacterized protein n=1 Tax=Pleurodeles waltl TaxID=8319 RepID=A0AAV7R804_PLEWA|nr:hypothetical protein NDU88_001750 [Pleurodeles waltl]
MWDSTVLKGRDSRSGEATRDSGGLGTLGTISTKMEEFQEVVESKDEHGQILCAAEEVDLYRSPLVFDEDAVTDYLPHIAMKWLMAEHGERLMDPLPCP